MHDQVKIVELLAGRLKEVSRKASRSVVENGRKLCQSDGCRLIERSGRTAAQDHLLDRVLRLFFFRQGLQSHSLGRRNARRNDRLLPPLSYFLYGRKRRRIMHLKHGGIFDLAMRKRDRFQAECMTFTGRWRRTVRSVPDRYEAQGNLAPGIEIEHAIHIGIHEPKHDLGGQSRSRRNGRHIRQQGAIVPTKMAIGACLILPGVPPVRPGANDGHGRANHRRFQRRRLSQVSAKITFSQKP